MFHVGDNCCHKAYMHTKYFAFNNTCGFVMLSCRGPFRDWIMCLDMNMCDTHIYPILLPGQSAIISISDHWSLWMETELHARGFMVLCSSYSDQSRNPTLHLVLTLFCIKLTLCSSPLTTNYSNHLSFRGRERQWPGRYNHMESIPSRINGQRQWHTWM